MIYTRFTEYNLLITVIWVLFKFVLHF